MTCKKVLLSNSCNHWIYFNFRRCSDNFFENQYGVEPLSHREIEYIDGTLVTAFETCAQIDPDGYNITGTTPSASPVITPTPTSTPSVTSTPTPSQSVFQFTFKYSAISSNDARLNGVIGTYYANSSTITLGFVALYSDSSLTTPANDGYYCGASGNDCVSQLLPSPRQYIQITGGSGVPNGAGPICNPLASPTVTPTPTKTPTTTLTLTLKYDTLGYYEACQSGVTGTYYTNNFSSSFPFGNLYTDISLTTPANVGYYVGTAPLCCITELGYDGLNITSPGTGQILGLGASC